MVMLLINRFKKDLKSATHMFWVFCCCCSYTSIGNTLYMDTDSVRILLLQE